MTDRPNAPLTPRWLRRTIGLVLLTAIAGCTEPPPMPAPPDVLESRDEYPFGTLTGSEDTRTWGRVWDSAEQVYGREGMRLERRVMPAVASWQALQAHYRERLSEEQGWHSDADIAFDATPRAWSFAFTDDDHFVALVGLQPERAEGGYVPVNIITNLPKR